MEQPFDLKIEHTDLSEKVYQTLKQMILNRHYSGGQKLNLNEISSQMNISRTPLKDAIKRLESEGFIETKPRSGTFVTKIEPKDIREIMEVRLMIEQHCLSNLTKNQTEELVKVLEDISLRSKALFQKNFSYKEFTDYDIQFHQAIVRMIGNERLFKIYQSQNSFLYISRVYYFKSFDRSVKGQSEHEQIIQYLKDYAIKNAVDSLRLHIENSKEQIIQILEENNGYI